MNSIVIRGALVLSDAFSAATHVDLLIREGRIVDLLLPQVDVADAEVVDGKGMLIHPGLVNAHMHAHTPLTKGMADRWSLELLLASGMRIYGAMSHEDRHIAALVGAAELVSKGCTTVYDMCLEGPVPTIEGVNAVARAYFEAGMRAIIAPMVSDRNFFQAIPGLMEAMPADVQRDLQRFRPPAYVESTNAMKRILKEWRYSHDIVKPALAPTIPLHCSDEFLLECKRLSAEFGVGIQTHLQESKVQALSGITRYGKTLTAHLDELGVLGPGFVAAHGVWLDDDDMERLGRSDASVSHNPGSNAILGSGLADVRRMLELGINVAIGTDGANCSDNLNMYESMRSAARVSHVRSPDMSRWLSAKEIFYAATEGGARATGFSDIGRIARGYRADLVMLDLSHFNWIPTNDVVVQLVQSEDGNAVHSVMIDGKWAVRNRQLTNIRTGILRERAQNAVSRLIAASAGNEELYQRLAPVVACFCPALMRTPYRVERFGAEL